MRRKRWVRRKRRAQEAQPAQQRAAAPCAGGTVAVVGVVQPGAKLPLPHNWAADRKQLQVLCATLAPPPPCCPPVHRVPCPHTDTAQCCTACTSIRLRIDRKGHRLRS